MALRGLNGEREVITIFAEQSASKLSSVESTRPPSEALIF